MRITRLFGLLFLGLTLPAISHSEVLNYNLYSLQAAVSRSVENDLMVVSLVATHQAATAAEAGNLVNTDMEWVLAEVEREQAVTARTERYTTSPQYRNQTIVGWTVSQSLHLETDDFEQLTDLVGVLQERVNVQSMQFSVKPETRKTVENQLIEEALAAYRERADIVAKSMKASSYDMVNTSLNTQGAYTPIYARAQSSKLVSSVAAPAVEAGESNVSVTVGGQIQLAF